MRSFLLHAVVVALLASPVAAQQVYFNDFEGTVGPEWSHTSTDITPLGARRFLGHFVNDEVTLMLNSLPAHTDVTIACDLYIMFSWDGNAGVPPTPDIWELAVVGGPTLLHTTFCNWYPETGWPEGRQSYPSDYPADLQARTGAVENNTLGYTFSGAPLDSVYSLTFAFPHSADSLALVFRGIGLTPQEVNPYDETWGLDNVFIHTTPIPEPSSLLALVCGLGALGGMAWRRRR